MNLKRQLRLLLEDRGMSAAKLAEKSGVSKQVLSLWLSGGSPRKIEQVKNVAEVLGTSVDHLCFGDGLSDGRPSDLDSLAEGQWMSGIFEVKIRRLKN